MSTFNNDRVAAGRLTTLLTGSLATLAIGSAALLSETYPAWAQHVMVARTDDSNGNTTGHMFVMPAMPARFGMLTRPEFTRRDVPLLKDTLNLDESQMYVAEVLFDSYSEQFREALDEFTDVRKRYRVRFPGMEDSDFPNGLDLMPPPEAFEIGENADWNFEGDGEAFAFSFDDMDILGEGHGNIEIGITRSVNVNSDVNVNDDGSGAPPDVQVAFVATDENGESLLTEEQQKEIVERISAQVRERLEQAQAKMEEAAARRAEIAEKRANGEIVEDKVEAATAEEVAKAARTFLAERNRLRDEMLADIDNMLSDEQRDNLPKFVRDHRRVNTMRYGEFAGESVDLLKIINQQQPKADDAAALAAAKSQYETELENALKTRNDRLLQHEVDMITTMDEMISSGSSDDAKYLQLMDKMAAARVALRDVNDRAAAAITPTLAAASRDEFDKSVRQESFPMLYSASLTQRTLTAAKKLDSVDEDTLAAINALANDYEAQIAQLNERIATQMRIDEPKEHRRMAEIMKKIHDMEHNMNNGPMELPEFEDSPHDKLMSERRDLNKRTLDQLRGMLSEEQLAQLPKRRMPELVHFRGPGGQTDGEGGVMVRTIDRSAPNPPPPPPPPGD